MQYLSLQLDTVYYFRPKRRLTTLYNAQTTVRLAESFPSLFRTSATCHTKTSLGTANVALVAKAKCTWSCERSQRGLWTPMPKMGSYFTIRCYKLDYASACMRTALLLPWALIQRDRGRARGQGVRGRGPLKLNTLKHLHTLRSPIFRSFEGKCFCPGGQMPPCPCLWAPMHI